MPNDWALVIGVNRYPRAGLDPLKGAVYDATEFHKWVTRPTGGAVDPGQAKLITSPDPPPPGIPRPLNSEIRSFIEDLKYSLDAADGRRLYIYLSGHGIAPAVQQTMRGAALLMADARPPDQWSNFAGTVWAAGARDAARFREVVLIMDCCRDLNHNAIPDPHTFGNTRPDATDCRLIEVYAAPWGSKARELPLPPANQTRGVFTHSLLQVLEAGKMTGALLKASVMKHLGRVLNDEKKARDLDIDGDLDKITFNEKADPPRTPVTITGHPAAPPVIESWPEDADWSVPVALDDWSYDGSSWQGTLGPGQYELRLPSGGGRRLKVFAGVPEEVSWSQ